jgi:hypothetical protein
MENQPEVKKSNPLAGYFRHPAIYMRLPSKGRFWPDEALDMPANEELAVYPMTTKDEITLKTPDALLNGAGIVSVLQSCIPNVVDAWQTPSVDVDAMLIAIRIATYGHEMDFETVCPHCQEENKHGIDLRPILDSMQSPDYSEKVVYNDIKIKLRPQPYFTANKSSMIQFEEQKIIDTLNNAELDPEVKNLEISKSMKRLTDISLNTLRDSTDYIEMPDGTIVNNKEHLLEFYQNVENKVVREIQQKLGEYNDSFQIAPSRVQCNDCAQEYSVPMTFDYANFFGRGF